jgi:hypothetical protein
MTVLSYKAGVSAVGQYQTSGIPYATASFTVPMLKVVGARELVFPNITRFFTIVNTCTGNNAPLRIGFSALGVTGSAAQNQAGVGGASSYFILNNGESFTGELRVRSIFLLGDSATAGSTASVIAGLTGISSSVLINNWTGSHIDYGGEHWV